MSSVVNWGGTIVFDLEEILMWAALKKAVAGVTESLGIEIPGLPIDLGAVGDAAATAAQGVTESATGAVEGLTGVTETLPGGVAGITDSVAGAAEGVSASAVDSAAQVLPDLTAAVGSANPSK
jgi:phage-related tail protein